MIALQNIKCFSNITEDLENYSYLVLNVSLRFSETPFRAHLFHKEGV